MSKLKLEIFSKNEDKQYVYLKHLILTYRAKLPLISELFQIDEEELYQKLIKYNDNSYRAFIYLFYHEDVDQDLAKREIIKFYNDLVNALVSKDKEEQHRLVNLISDSDAFQVIKKSNSGQQLSEDDILVIMRHQLKYAMSYRGVATLFSQHRHSMCLRMERLIGDDEELKEKFRKLIAFNEDMWDRKK